MKSIYLVVIIVLVIISIYLLFFYNRIEDFNVKTDTITSNTMKDTGEMYPYPGCTGCITSSNKLKPGFK